MFDNKQRKLVKDAKIGCKDGMYYDLMGISGEMAVHKYFELPFKFELYDVRDRVDITVGRYTFDVKTSRYPTLKVPVFQKNGVDGYILTTCDPAMAYFTIQGVISQKKFLKAATRDGDWLILPAEKLGGIELVTID